MILYFRLSILLFPSFSNGGAGLSDFMIILSQYPHLNRHQFLDEGGGGYSPTATIFEQRLKERISRFSLHTLISACKDEIHGLIILFDMQIAAY